MKGFLQLLSQWRDFLLLDRSQNGDLFLEARQLPVRQALAEDASQNVVLAEAAQHSQLLQLRRLDFQQEFLIQPVDCFLGERPTGCVLHIDGEEIAGHEMSVAQMDDPMRRLFDLDGVLDLADAWQWLQDFSGRR
jgi:hypothetical protein